MSDNYKISGEYLNAKVDSIEKNVRETGEKIDKIFDKLNKMESRILSLEIKSGLWGALGGTIIVLGQILSKKFGQ